MRKRSFMSVSTALAIVMAGIVGSTPGRAGGVTGQATEWTQLLNNGELVALVGKSSEQINNQMTQIAQLAEQIQNQIRMYENMLQNTAQLPFHVWSQVENDLNRLRSLVAQGEGIAFSVSNADDVLRQRFESYGEFKTGLADGQTFSSSYEKWSTTNRDTIAGTLKAIINTTVVPTIQDPQMQEFVKTSVDPLQWRQLLFGLTLVVMMLVRPEGLIPSARRRAELRSEAPAGTEPLSIQEADAGSPLMSVDSDPLDAPSQ